LVNPDQHPVLRLALQLQEERQTVGETTPMR
jgi:hypothetical protein